VISAPLLSTFRAVASALEDEGIPYATIGALGRAVWSRPRATTDIDLAVASDAALWPRILAALSRLGLALTQQTPPGEEPPDTAFFRVPGGVRVDLLIAKTEFEKEVLARRIKIDFLGTAVWVATPEDLVIYKLIAGRPRDLTDIAEILSAQRASGRTLDWARLEHWAGEWGVAAELAHFKDQAG
jgi:hypothetical protein